MGGLQYKVQRVLDLPFTSRIEYSGSGNPIYVGEADPGTGTGESNWRIKKIAYTSNNPISVKWASGDANPNKIWADRATYIYS